MNAKEVQHFITRYLEATECHIMEKSPSHVTVKLSPEADKDLTNRPYYWSFVERTGAEPQTMTMTFVFDPEKKRQQESQGKPKPVSQAAYGSEPPGTDSILGRYLGFAPAPPAAGRVPLDEVTYGSRRLQQLFGIVRSKGRFVQMYEDYKAGRNAPPAVYQTWLAVNYKIEYCCDMKRDELHSLGISLTSGAMVEDFLERLADLPLTPRPPANTLLQRPVWSLQRAVAALEQAVEKEIRNYNHDWANAAQERLQDELQRVDAYYNELLPGLEPEARGQAEAQYEARRREIEWQYRPRIESTVINAGVFHLGIDTIS